jgi:hypothetical protein
VGGTGSDKRPVRNSRTPRVATESPKNFGYRLPRLRDSSEECCVAAPRIAIERPQVRYDARTEGIEMEVPYELKQVGFLFYHNGFVPILEQMAGAAVAPIEGPRVPSEEAPHAAGEGAHPRPHQQMGVIRQESPGKNGQGAYLPQRGQTGNKIASVAIVSKDGLPLDSSHHDMVQSSRGVQARPSRHGETVA